MNWNSSHELLISLSQGIVLLALGEHKDALWVWDSSRGQPWPQLRRWAWPERHSCLNVIKIRGKSSQPCFFRAEACPAEGQELCDSTSRGNPALSQLLALGGRARCGHSGAAYWQGPGDRPLKTSFNKIDLMRSSAPCGMLITKQPGEKCLGIKGVATLVLLSVLVFWWENQQTLATAWLPRTNKHLPEPGYHSGLTAAKKSHQTIPHSSHANLGSWKSLLPAYWTLI